MENQACNMTKDEQQFYDACAIAAMNAVLMADVPDQISGDETDQQKAAWACFSIADAMLAERRKRRAENSSGAQETLTGREIGGE